MIPTGSGGPSPSSPNTATPGRAPNPAFVRQQTRPLLTKERSWLATLLGPHISWITTILSKFLFWRPAAVRDRQSAPDAREPSLQEFLSFDTYIFDCDGVIWGIDAEDTVTAVETINYLLDVGKRALFVTNNSNKRRADFVRELESRGVNFRDRNEEERVAMVISASYTTAQYLSEHGYRHPFVITSDTGILEELKIAGINDYFSTVDDDCRTQPEFESIMQHGEKPEIPEIISAHPDVDCIVVGWDKGLTARKIGTAVNYIRFHEDLNRHEENFQHMPIIACSGDASGSFGTAMHKGASVKFRAVGNGAMAEAIAGCFDPRREWLDMGKPSEVLLECLRSPQAYDVNLSRALMIGDTLQTDIVFGNRGNMTTLLVLTGVTTQDELEDSLAQGYRERVPSYVLPSLGYWAERGELPPQRNCSL